MTGIRDWIRSYRIARRWVQVFTTLTETPSSTTELRAIDPRTPGGRVVRVQRERP